MNADGAALAKTQGAENLRCLKLDAVGKLIGTAQDCLTADMRGKIQKRKDKTVAHEALVCTMLPSFGYTGSATVNTSAVQAELDLTEDIFGPDLDAAIIPCATSKTGCVCQKAVMGRVEALAATKVAVFRKCKAVVLKAGASSASALAQCVNDAGQAESIAADTRGKIQKRIDKLNADIVKRCDTPGVSGAFPNKCSSLTGSALGACLDAQVECRVCQLINEMDGLFVNCDLFDDGAANMTCESGTGPPPTPTPPFSPGTIFQGALPASTGLFNYAGIGLPGSDSACNTAFAGSHTCTISELQAAETAGDLDGAVDTASNLVTSFWAVDPLRPDIEQCVGGAAVRWNYQTVHTPSRGDVVNLNNGAGTLGAVMQDQVCATQHWVGCCL
jgi:hypothetical protein